MRFTSRLNPVGGIQDLWSEFRRPNPYRWRILAFSIFVTGLIFSPIVREEFFIEPAKPEVTYITSFAPGRSDAEIIKSNEIYQERKELREAAYAASEERKKELYRKLGRATGVDVDAMEREIAKENAAEEAEKKRLQAAAQAATQTAGGASTGAATANNSGLADGSASAQGTAPAAPRSPTSTTVPATVPAPVQ